MSDIATDLTPLIRDAAAPPRPAGYTAPDSGDVAQAPAIADQGANATGSGGRQSDFPIDGDTSAARRGAANHFGWKPQAALEIQSYAETFIAADVADGDSLELDITRSTVWRINAAGAMTLTVADLPTGTVGIEDASRAFSFSLYIQRAAGGTITWPAGTQFGLDVLDPNGDGDRTDSLLAAPAAARMDVFVLVNVPAVGWVGTIAALGLSAV